MTALNKNGIIHAIPLKGPTMKAAVLEKHNKNPHVLFNKAFYSPLSTWRVTVGKPMVEIEA